MREINRVPMRKLGLPGYPPVLNHSGQLDVAHLRPAIIRALTVHSTQMRLSDEIATLLDGGTPEMSMPMFTTVDHATSTYVRNPDWLLSGAEGATSLCVACPSLTSNNITYRKVAKLTPHVCMVAWHARYVNQTYRWVTLDNEVINIASAPLPEGLTGYETQGNCLRIGTTDIGLYRMADAIPDSIDCLPIADPADHLVLTDLVSVLNIPLMGLLGGGVSHVNRAASPRLLASAGGAKPWPDAAWFHQVENFDSGSLIGYLTKSRFAAVVQLMSYGVGSAGSGPSLPSYIDTINQAIADLGYPDEQLTVAPVLGA